MKKVYQVPEVECISLVSEEDVMANGGFPNGSMKLEDSIF